VYAGERLAPKEKKPKHVCRGRKGHGTAIHFCLVNKKTFFFGTAIHFVTVSLPPASPVFAGYSGVGESSPKEKKAKKAKKRRNRRYCRV
jgi:hypothetical protein